ncbi:hypothetical protein AVEN_52386-1 [Araneus ventricosus]|uniref:Uncharacterized protein n=1 Tax=Araneus ventricosus TaxID=182803 RepID=A0A4Y2L1R8_ARAVE|nr:hypothetical protein AVEN_52386-1 [Araneus ventricosus]
MVLGRCPHKHSRGERVITNLVRLVPTVREEQPSGVLVVTSLDGDCCQEEGWEPPWRTSAKEQVQEHRRWPGRPYEELFLNLGQSHFPILIFQSADCPVFRMKIIFKSEVSRVRINWGTTVRTKGQYTSNSPVAMLQSH